MDEYFHKDPFSMHTDSTGCVTCRVQHKRKARNTPVSGNGSPAGSQTLGGGYQKRYNKNSIASHQSSDNELTTSSEKNTNSKSTSNSESSGQSQQHRLSNSYNQQMLYREDEETNWDVLHRLIPNADGTPVREMCPKPYDIDELIQEYEDGAEIRWWIVIVSSVTLILITIFALTN